MKRLLFAAALFALLLPAARQAQAHTDVSIDFFYDNLGSDGSWVDVEDYGYCWQPSVAVSNNSWRPYSDGYWAYTDVGWTWVSYESFGWATYHYGRWAHVRNHGWMWAPGREWGPAWVSWRTGGDYVGWAPLPPRRYSGGGGEVVYEGREIGGQVDIDFDIGPSYYNFVDVRYIGEPVLRERIFASDRNYAYINNTVNVTNITYRDSQVYNYGPDYDRLSAYSTRPIQRLSLQRESNVDIYAAARAGSLTRVQGNMLLVAAPQQFQRNAQPVAPKQLKQKIAKAELETGWMGVSDPKAKAELQQKWKKENPKNVPPPQVAPQNPAALTAASPAPVVGSSPTAPIASATPAVAAQEKGRGKNKRGQANQTLPVAGATPTAAAPDGSAPVTPLEQGRGKGKNKRGNAKTNPPVSAATDNTLSAPPTPAPSPEVANAVAPAEKGDGKGKNKRNQLPPTAPSGAAVEPSADAGVSAQTAAPAEKGKGKGNKKDRRGEATLAVPPAPEAAAGPQLNENAAAVAPVEQPAAVPAGNEKGRGKQKSDRPNVPPPSPETAPAAQMPASPEQPRMKKERQMPQPQAAPAGPAGEAAPAPPSQGRGKPEKGNKKKKGDEPPAPEQ